jgi:hypothetical protein
MSAEIHAPVDDDATARGGASAYGDYLAERDEITRHKWVLSERAGRDVGFETALMDWAQNHRSQWRKLRSRLPDR